MNRFLIWILGILVGAFLGYGVGFVTGLNLYLCMGTGVIFGSSIGITINMQRRKYRDFRKSSIAPDLDEEQVHEEQSGSENSSTGKQSSSA